MTFQFDTAVIVNEIELDLFRCPEMGISTPTMSLYADEGDNLVLAYQNKSSFYRVTKYNLDTSWPSLPLSLLGLVALKLLPSAHCIF